MSRSLPGMSRSLPGMSRRLLVRCAVAMAVVSAVAVGCVDSKPKGKTVQEALGLPDMPKGPPPATVEDALLADPCTNRMQDLAGALLMYYAMNRTLPKTLDDLSSLEDVTGKLKLTCPASNQPYVYDLQGLHTVGGKKYIIAYDPTPAHGGEAAKKLGGARNVIVTPEEAKGNTRSFEVMLMPEGTFKTYNLRQPM